MYPGFELHPFACCAQTEHSGFASSHLPNKVGQPSGLGVGLEVGFLVGLAVGFCVGFFVFLVGCEVGA